MKEACPKCFADYFEIFEDGGAHCFGCGHHVVSESLPFVSGAGRGPKHRTELTVQLGPLEQEDYTRLAHRWKLTRAQVTRYGLARARASDGSTWLYLPVFDEHRKVIHSQLRAWGPDWEKPVGKKYMTKSAPPGPLVWRSWFTPMRPPYVAVVEGILDGIRVADHVTTVAIMGSDVNEEKVRSLHALGTPDTCFLVMLDADVPKKALKLAEALGIIRTRIVILPMESDPADLTSEQLAQLLSGYIQKEDHGGNLERQRATGVEGAVSQA